MSKYEYIIIGGGIAGMITAGYLAKEGRKVLIVEKTGRLGGRINITKYKNIFMQDQGPQQWLWNNGGYWMQAARDFGCNIKYTYYPQISVYIKDSKQPPKAMPVFCTAEAMTEFVMSQMPAGIPADTEEEFYKMFKIVLGMNYQEFCKVESILLKDWIEEITENPIVQDYCYNYVATNTMLEKDRVRRLLSAMPFVAAIRHWSCGEGFLTIMHPDPDIGFAQEFAKAMTRLGVEVMLKTEVDKIIIENKTAKGVLLKNGEKIEADKVIVNAVFTQVAKLFDEVPEDIQSSIDSMEQVGLQDFYLAFRLRSNPFTENGVIQIIDRDGVNRGCISTQSTYMPWSVGEDPECKHLSIYTAVYPVDRHMTLEKAIEEATECQEDCFPGFKDAIIDVHGISHYPLWHHAAVLNRFSNESPSIQGLYFCGDSVKPQVCQGVDGAASTGVFLAEKLLGKTLVPFVDR